MTEDPYMKVVAVCREGKQIKPGDRKYDNHLQCLYNIFKYQKHIQTICIR